VDTSNCLCGGEGRGDGGSVGSVSLSFVGLVGGGEMGVAFWTFLCLFGGRETLCLLEVRRGGQ